MASTGPEAYLRNGEEVSLAGTEVREEMKLER